MAVCYDIAKVMGHGQRMIQQSIKKAWNVCFCLVLFGKNQFIDNKKQKRLLQTFELFLHVCITAQSHSCRNLLHTVLFLTQDACWEGFLCMQVWVNPCIEQPEIVCKEINVPLPVALGAISSTIERLSCFLHPRVRHCNCVCVYVCEMREKP